MKTLLICPSPRPSVRPLAEAFPLALVPMFGQGLVEYWLTHLACSGVKQVHLLVHDRPECLRALVGNGVRWGLTVEITNEASELTPAELLIKYDQQCGPAPVQNGIAMLDHFPATHKSRSSIAMPVGSTRFVPGCLVRSCLIGSGFARFVRAFGLVSIPGSRPQHVLLHLVGSAKMSSLDRGRLLGRERLSRTAHLSNRMQKSSKAMSGLTLSSVNAPQ